MKVLCQTQAAKVMTNLLSHWQVIRARQQKLHKMRSNQIKSGHERPDPSVSNFDV
jgi:hypothetical protein